MITEEQWDDAGLIWRYHVMGHRPRPCSAAIGLGSHDLGVATAAAELYHQGLFPVIVFSGGNSPTTADRFPRGEAVHYRERAIELGVPAEAILLEPHATNTGQNITFSREILRTAGVTPDSLLLIAKPYMERRAYATCRKLWPEPDLVCASQRLTLDDYAKTIGDANLVLNMIVGDLQRVIDYPARDYAIPQPVPPEVRAAQSRLIQAGFTTRLPGP
ncbi:MAG: YdcF family protein [Streptosporangiales bacterium]|nr:YdcF family protein [Streptosporangiales bacterium]